MGSAAPAAPVFLSPPSATVIVVNGVAGTWNISASGVPGATIANTGSLPTGVTFAAGAAGSGEATLTVTAAAAIAIDSLQFTATNSSGSVVQNFTLSVATLTNGDPGASSTNMIVAKPGKATTITQTEAAQWVGLGVTSLAFCDAPGDERLSPGMGGATAWTGGATGLPTYQAALISNASVANVHAAGGLAFLGAILDSGGTLGPAILSSWFDTGIGHPWYPGAFATASTTITTSATGTLTFGSTVGLAASGTVRVQPAIGIPAVVVTYTGGGGGAGPLTGCSVASGTLTVTSGTSLVAPGPIREAIQCFAAAAASLGFDGLELDCEPYTGEGHIAQFSTTLSSALSTGGPITSLPIHTPTGSIAGSGYPVILSAPGGQTQTFISSGASTGTAVPVNSQTPNFAYPTGTAVEWGRYGWAWDSSAGPAHNVQSAVNAQAVTDGQAFMQWLADAWTAYATGSNPTPQIMVMDSFFSAVVLNNGSLNTSGQPQTPFTPNTQGSLDEAVIFAVDGGTGFQSSTWQYFWAGTLQAVSAGMPSLILFATEILYRGPQGIGCPMPGSWSSTQGAGPCLDMALAYLQETTLAALSQIASPAGWAAMQNKVRAIPGIWIDGDGSGGFQGFPDNLTDVHTLLGNGAVGKMAQWTASDAPIWLYQNSGGTIYAPQPTPASPEQTAIGFDYHTGSRGGSTTPGADYSNTDYTPAMTNVMTAYVVDSSDPTFGTFSPASGGSHAHGAMVVTGIATTDNAVASVEYVVNGGAVQGAVLYPNILSGSFTTGFTRNTLFAAAVTLPLGAGQSVEFTVTAVSGLQTSFTWTQTGT